MAYTYIEGSETIGTTEHSLTTDTFGPDANTTEGDVQLYLDLNALAAGDEFELKFYEKVLSSSTQRVVWSSRFAGAQGGANSASQFAMRVKHGWDFTLKKIAGTDRAIDWSIRLSPAPAVAGNEMALTSAYDFAKGTAAMTEAYAANGAEPTPIQALYSIQQTLQMFAISGTTYSVKKLDNSTTAFVITLNDATSPTGATRT
jgi:hypothetical protein